MTEPAGMIIVVSQNFERFSNTGRSEQLVVLSGVHRPSESAVGLEIIGPLTPGAISGKMCQAAVAFAQRPVGRIDTFIARSMTTPSANPGSTAPITTPMLPRGIPSGEYVTGFRALDHGSILRDQYTCRLAFLTTGYQRW